MTLDDISLRTREWVEERKKEGWKSSDFHRAGSILLNVKPVNIHSGKPISDQVFTLLDLYDQSVN